jgi:hypothetical protein
MENRKSTPEDSVPALGTRSHLLEKGDTSAGGFNAYDGYANSSMSRKLRRRVLIVVLRMAIFYIVCK